MTNSIASLRSPEISSFKVYFSLKKSLRKIESAAENQKAHFTYALFRLPAEFLKLWKTPQFLQYAYSILIGLNKSQTSPRRLKAPRNLK